MDQQANKWGGTTTIIFHALLAPGKLRRKIHCVGFWHPIPFDPNTMKHEGLHPQNMGYNP